MEMRFLVKDAARRMQRDVAIRLDGAPSTGDLIEALVDYLAWPTAAADGTPLRYAVTIERTAVQLDPAVPAAQSGLRDGDTLIVAMPAIDAPAPQASSPVAVILTLPSGERRTLAAGSYVIGRSSASDIRLDDESVSRRHALLHVAADGSVQIEDAGSRNGLYVEEARVTQSAVRDGAQLRVGDSILTVHLER